MMTGVNVARLAKLIALFGFFLPWVLVSCSGEPIGRLSGIDLATGGGAAQGAGPNLGVMVSLAAVIGGLLASFMMKGRQAIVGMLAAAVVALIAGTIGLSTVSSSVQAQPQRSAAALGQVTCSTATSSPWRPCWPPLPPARRR
jgi:hypothetical protein